TARAGTGRHGRGAVARIGRGDRRAVLPRGGLAVARGVDPAADGRVHAAARDSVLEPARPVGFFYTGDGRVGRPQVREHGMAPPTIARQLAALRRREWLIRLAWGL